MRFRATSEADRIPWNSPYLNMALCTDNQSGHRYFIAVHDYLFGQHRLQVLHERFAFDPDPTILLQM